MSFKGLSAGTAAAVAGRALVVRLLLVKFGRDLRRLNAGDHSTLLKAYADDAVLRFHQGDHRSSGDWTGRANIDRFLQNLPRQGSGGRSGRSPSQVPPGH